IETRQRGAREPGLETAPPAAIAARSRLLLGLGPGQGVVPPFSGNGMRPASYLTVEDKPAAEAGPGDDAEDQRKAVAGPADGLGQGQAIGIIGKFYRPLQGIAQIPLEWLAVEPGRVGVVDQPRRRRDGAGDGHADAPDGSELRRRALDKRFD